MATANPTAGVAPVFGPRFPREEAWFRRVLRCDPCAYCECKKPPGDRLLTLDHVVPESEGGTGDAFNLVSACVRCNHDKAAMSLLEYLPARDDMRAARQRRRAALRQRRQRARRRAGRASEAGAGARGEEERS